MNPWEQVKQQLEAALSPESYHQWVSTTVFNKLDGGILRVWVLNGESKAWLETEYAEQVNGAIRKMSLPVNAVLYELSGNAKESVVEVEREVECQAPAYQLNPRFTFDTFVVGACNQFAHAAARS